MSSLPVTLEDVQLAAARIGGAVVHTPCLRSETLSRIARADIWIKFENLQFTASFKERGALNTLLQLTPDERKRGVIAMSAGNHAQGVAYHAGRLGIPATIVMPSFTPNVKVQHTPGHGAPAVLLAAPLPGAAALVGRGVRLRGVASEPARALVRAVGKTGAGGAGAAGPAALRAPPQLFPGRKAGLGLCGGNSDPRLLASVLLRGLVRDGRIV